MIMEILSFPNNDVLRRKAIKVEKIDDALLKLIDDMGETMYAAPGYGLAAPQVGVSLRLFVGDPFPHKENSKLIAYINPEIIEGIGEQMEEEGCLSIPGEYAPVKRFMSVKVKYTDRDGNEKIDEAEGLLARLIQHEIDHLDGRLFLDKVSIFKRDLIKKSIRRRIKAGDYKL